MRPTANLRRFPDFDFLCNQFGQWVVIPQHDQCQTDLAGLLEDQLVIETDRNSTKFAEAVKRWNSSDSNLPSLFIIHLTQRCNLTCGFCHSSAVGPDAPDKDLAVETLDRIFRFIFDAPGKDKNICFQGGEPTLAVPLIDHFLDLLEALHDRPNYNINVFMTTNGTLLTRDLASKMRSRGVSLSLSVDGPEEIHDQERRYADGSGSYKDTLAARSLMNREYSDIYDGQIMVVTPSSKHRVKEILDELVASGQREFRFKFVTPLGRGKKYVREKGKIDADEYIALYIEVLAELKRIYKDDGIILFETYLMTLINKMFMRVNRGDIDTKNPCGIAAQVVDFDIFGRVHACHETNKYKDFLLGDSRSTYEQIFSSPRALQIRDSTDLSRHEACRSCAYFSYCTPCPARNYQENGSPEVKPFESFMCVKTLGILDYIIQDMYLDVEYYIGVWKAYVIKRTLMSFRN